MEQNTQEHLALIAATLKINQEQQQANKQKLQEQKQAFEQGKNTITIVLISLSVLIIAILYYTRYYTIHEDEEIKR